MSNLNEVKKEGNVLDPKTIKDVVTNNGSLGVVALAIYLSVSSLTSKVENMQDSFQKSLQVMHGQAMDRVDTMTKTLNKVVTITAIQSREIELGIKRDGEIKDAIRFNAEDIKKNKESIIRINQKLLR